MTASAFGARRHALVVLDSDLGAQSELLCDFGTFRPTDGQHRDSLTSYVRAKSLDDARLAISERGTGLPYGMASSFPSPRGAIRADPSTVLRSE
jgi:hypothetical protein